LAAATTAAPIAPAAAGSMRPTVGAATVVSP
jgi:hypothetical protein